MNAVDALNVMQAALKDVAGNVKALIDENAALKGQNAGLAAELQAVKKERERLGALVAKFTVDGPGSDLTPAVIVREQSLSHHGEPINGPEPRP